MSTLTIEAMTVRRASLIFCLLLTTAGCGSGDRPQLGVVSGTVTLDGSPLANARIVFQPESQNRASYGVTDGQGTYELIYLRDVAGAVVGRHKVLIDRLAAKEGERADLLPKKYNARSELGATISPGANLIDFALQSSQ